MDWTRSDTYINVYLPREDGGDPRRYAQSNSPLFDAECVYKFSDEIVKDRKLFLGKKHMSLYEIYYKDGRDVNGKPGTPEMPGDGDTNDEKQEPEGQFVRRVQEKSARHSERTIQLPRVNKISISLEKKLRRLQNNHASRFNEPVSPWTSTGRVRGSNEGTLDRQLTQTEVARVKTNKQLARGLTHTQNISRLFKSAPASETRQVRILGLPPINRASAGGHGSPDMITARLSLAATGPIRPSSKPNKIWRQSTDLMSAGYSMERLVAPSARHLSTRGSSRLRSGYIHSNV
ncbi:hypothetical protein DPMN_035398 [Dreissena polymorpha]|uniref:Uncharacterized protein n=1 Tax=Dreissena polymorpha TaxID=45954 RepID=A0A9D4M8P4_DREPO|nr:hypothetical protein DPMN_035398 [Dreissena polymorpha]